MTSAELKAARASLPIVLGAIEDLSRAARHLFRLFDEDGHENQRWALEQARERIALGFDLARQAHHSIREKT